MGRERAMSDRAHDEAMAKAICQDPSYAMELLDSILDEGEQGEMAASHLPKRVLPVSTSPPTDLATLFDSEIKEIKKLLQPGRRRQIEAFVRLRPLAILDATIRGEKGQPSDSDLRRICKDVSDGKDWASIFQGAAAVELAADGTGPRLSLRLSKKEGIPIQLVVEGTPGASVVAVKRVDELSFYSLGAKQLAEKVGLTMPRPSRTNRLLQGDQDRQGRVQAILPEGHRLNQGGPERGDRR